MGAPTSAPRLLIFALIIGAAVAAAFLAGSTAWGERVNNSAIDWFFGLRGPEKPSDNIVLVAIDDETVTRFGWPMDRGLLASALNRICAARPSVVGLDLLFTEPSNPESDQALAVALRGCPQTVQVARLVDGGNADGGNAGPAWSLPLADFAQSAAALAHPHTDPDMDGVSRRILLAKAAARVRHWALALEAFRIHTRHNGPITEDDDGLNVGTRRVPAPADQAAGIVAGAPGGSAAQRPLIINYAGGEGTFQRYSLLQILQSDPIERLGGKAVLIGVTGHGISVADRKFTPFSIQGSDMAGVEIHANLLHTLVSGRFLVPMRPAFEMGWLLAIGVVVAAPLALLRGMPLTLTMLAIGAGVHALPYILFTQQMVVAPAFSFILAFWLPLVAGGAFQYATVWRRYVAANASTRRMRDRLEMVSHEMRSPLAAIQGSSELMSKYPVNDERRKQLADLISRESQRLSNMVERFLDVERLEAGDMQLRQERVPLRPLVERTVSRVDPLVKRKSIELRTTMAATPATWGDGELIEFALYNLVNNAVKYSPENSTVDITVRANSALGMAFLDVADQGSGIPAEEHSKIFDRFYRTDTAKGSGQPGLGLGLSIVREIVRHHGGSVIVESTPGRGSKFSLALPMHEE